MDALIIEKETIQEEIEQLQDNYHKLSILVDITSGPMANDLHELFHVLEEMLSDLQTKKTQLSLLS